MMTSKKKTTRFVRPLSKGQITIPIEFRRQLGISEETILGVTLREDKIEISPLRPLNTARSLREYSDVEIRRFLKEDRIDAKTASRVRRLLGKRLAS